MRHKYHVFCNDLCAARVKVVRRWCTCTVDDLRPFSHCACACVCVCVCVCACKCGHCVVLTVSQICSLTCFPSIVIIRAPNSTPAWNVCKTRRTKDSAVHGS